MADPITAAIAWVGSEIGGQIGAVLIMNATEIAAAVTVASTVATVYNAREQQRRAQNQAKDAYNASLRDRYVMTRGATEPRQLVLGRCRVSGPLFFAGSYGTNKEHLVFTLALAGHEIDAVEAVYFDDHLLTLDGSGNVIGVLYEEQFSISSTSASFTLQSRPKAGTVTAVATYNGVPLTLGTSVSGSTVTVSGASGSATGLLVISYQPDPCPFLPATQQSIVEPFSLSATSGTFTLSQAPDPGSVSASFDADLDGIPDLVLGVSVSGSNVTVSGAPGTTGNVSITYQASSVSSKARIRKYLGTATQAADAGLIAALPGVWTSAHTATGVAYLVVELDYDPDAFQAQPNVSARIRGAKVYDPRTGTTAFSTNPALLARHAALHRLCGRLTADLINDTKVITAANACDQSTAYRVNNQTTTRARFSGGIVHKAGNRPQDTIKALCDAMAGEHVFIEGQLQLKAGVWSTPLQTLDDTWLADGQPVRVQPQRERGDVFNVITGTFADETQKYQVVEFPRVAPAAYITADGGVELPLPVQLDAVQFSGQAQFVCAIRQRDARQPITLTVLCNLRAYACEVFDVIYVTLSRFGWVNKPFEVRDTAFTLDGGIQLVLKETDSSIYDLDAGFPAQDPAPNTRLPSPFVVATVPALAAASGTAHLLKQADGSIVSRMLVSWGAIADAAVLASTGAIEIRYGLANLADAAHRSIEVPGADRQVYISDVLDGAVYSIKARARNALVAGNWSLPITHKVIGKTAAPGNVSVFTGSVSKGRIVWAWTPSQEVDYADTEVRSSDANWGAISPAPLFRGSASNWAEVVSTTGTFQRYARHFDTSGNPSAASATAAVSVAAGDLVQDGAAGADGRSTAQVAIYQRSSGGAPTLPSATVTYTFATGVATGLNNGWQQGVPSGTAPLYVSVAAAISTTATDTIAAGEWATPVVLAQDGGPGINTATIYLFQRTATSTPPSVPSASVTYTFATGATSGVNNGWLNYLAGTGGSYRWLTQATALGSGATDTIATGEWSAPQLVSDATGALAALNSVGTGQIDAAAATEIYPATATGITITGQTGVPFGTLTDVVTVTFTAPVTGDALVTCSANFQYITAASGTTEDFAKVRTALVVNSTRQTNSTRTHLDAQVGFSTTREVAGTYSTRLAVTSGTSYTVTFAAQKLTPGATVTANDAEARVEIIKR